MPVPFTKRPYLPRVRMYRTDGTNYDYHPLNNVYDFTIRSLDFRPVFDGLAGSFTMTLTSQNGSLSGMRTILSEVKEGNEVLIGVGKTLAGVTDVYRGVIEQTEVVEENPNWMDIQMTGIDWGSLILGGLKVNHALIQKKAADGITLDNNDTTTKLAAIVEAMCTDANWYPTAGTTIKASDLGLIVSAANLKYPNINVAQFMSNMESIDDKIREIDKEGFCYHYVAPDRTLYAKTIGSETTNKVLLASDDKDDALFSSWDANYTTILAKTNSIKRTLENHAIQVFGMGGDELVLDQSQTTDAGETETGTQFLAMKFQPIAIDLEYVEIKISKEGSPAGKMAVAIKEDLNGEPKGDTVTTVQKEHSSFVSGAAADWSPFQTSAELNTAHPHWIVIEKSSAYDANNNMHWRRDSGTTNTNATSSDGITWVVNPNSTGFCFRTKYKHPLMVTFPADNSVTSSSKHFVQEVIRKPDITHRATLQMLIEQEAKMLRMRKEVWNGYIYVPNTIPIAGQKVRIRKTLGGYQVDTEGSTANPHFIIATPEYHFEDSAATQSGTLYLNLTGSRFLPFP